MAIALRGSAQYANTGTTTLSSLSVNAPTGLVAGDVIIIWVARAAAAPTYTVSGFTSVTMSSNANISCQLFYRIATGSEGATFSITVATARTFAVACAAFSGVNNSTPFDPTPTTTSGQLNTSSLTVASNGVTTSAANDMMLWLGEVNSTGLGGTPATIGVPSGFTIQGAQSNTSSSGMNTGIICATEVKATVSGAVTGNGSISPATINGALLLGLIASNSTSVSVKATPLSAGVMSRFTGKTYAAPTSSIISLPSKALSKITRALPTSVTSLSRHLFSHIFALTNGYGTGGYDQGLYGVYSTATLGVGKKVLGSVVTSPNVSFLQSHLLTLLANVLSSVFNVKNLFRSVASLSAGVSSASRRISKTFFNTVASAFGYGSGGYNSGGYGYSNPRIAIRVSKTLSAVASSLYGYGLGGFGLGGFGSPSVTIRLGKVAKAVGSSSSSVVKSLSRTLRALALSVSLIDIESLATPLQFFLTILAPIVSNLAVVNATSKFVNAIVSSLSVSVKSIMKLLSAVSTSVVTFTAGTAHMVMLLINAVSSPAVMLNTAKSLAAQTVSIVREVLTTGKVLTEAVIVRGSAVKQIARIFAYLSVSASLAFRSFVKIISYTAITLSSAFKNVVKLMQVMSSSIVSVSNFIGKNFVANVVSLVTAFVSSSTLQVAFITVRARLRQFIIFARRKELDEL